MEWIWSPGVWNSLADIVVVNLLLSGDNAIVIAVAAHALPAKQQRPAILLGGGIAILMRIALTIFALKLLALPYLKIVGGILLFCIAVKLTMHQNNTKDIRSHSTLGGAVRTILVADLIMSLDNVLGVAAAAKGNVFLLTVGLFLSVPLIVFGSTVALKLMKKYPLLLAVGAALLAYLGGEMLCADTAIQNWVQVNLPNRELSLGATELRLSLPGIGSALAALLIGRFTGKR